MEDDFYYGEEFDYATDGKPMKKYNTWTPDNERAFYRKYEEGIVPQNPDKMDFTDDVIRDANWHQTNKWHFPENRVSKIRKQQYVENIHPVEVNITPQNHPATTQLLQRKSEENLVRYERPKNSIENMLKSWNKDGTRVYNLNRKRVVRKPTRPIRIRKTVDIDRINKFKKGVVEQRNYAEQVYDGNFSWTDTKLDDVSTRIKAKYNNNRLNNVATKSLVRDNNFLSNTLTNRQKFDIVPYRYENENMLNDFRSFLHQLQYDTTYSNQDIPNYSHEHIGKFFDEIDKIDKLKDQGYSEATRNVMAFTSAMNFLNDTYLLNKNNKYKQSTANDFVRNERELNKNFGKYYVQPLMNAIDNNMKFGKVRKLHRNEDWNTYRNNLHELWQGVGVDFYDTDKLNLNSFGQALDSLIYDNLDTPERYYDNEPIKEKRTRVVSFRNLNPVSSPVARRRRPRAATRRRTVPTSNLRQSNLDGFLYRNNISTN